MNEQKIEFEMANLVLSTYNKIVLWLNNDYDTDRQKSDALKIVSQDIIQTVLEDLMQGMNLKTTTEITRDGVKVGDIQVTRDENSFNINEEDVFNKLFDNK